MKTMNEYLSTKINPKWVKTYEEFPNEPKIHEIQRALDTAGFVKVKRKTYSVTLGSISQDIKSQAAEKNERVYIIGDCGDSKFSWWIMFGDKTKAFLCRETHKFTKYSGIPDDSFSLYENSIKPSKKFTYKEFINTVKEYFNL